MSKHKSQTKAHAYIFIREANGDDPGGYTVSKRSTLPEGDFQITEYRWGKDLLCFVDTDNFTEAERQAAYIGYLRTKFRS